MLSTLSIPSPNSQRRSAYADTAQPLAPALVHTLCFAADKRIHKPWPNSYSHLRHL